MPLAIATILDGAAIAKRVFAGPTVRDGEPEQANGSNAAILRNLSALSIERMQSIDRGVELDGIETRVWVDYRAARPGLWIFGAGDDAKPLHRLARELGWFVSIVDGRRNLATRERFPAADSVTTLSISTLPDAASSLLSNVKATDAAVLLTHSFEQDSHELADMFAREVQLAYVGVLGPQRRTREVLAEAAKLLGLPDSTQRAEEWLPFLHAPTGLDLGAETPAAIALSIIAEIQQTLNNCSALPLRQVRAVHPAITEV
jgi:xanthine/CO dehydrogenase XdhC/CoxF family maturation factor